MYEVLILLVLVNLGFTSYIWQTVRRGPKRKILGKLLNGKPITPNHTPSSLRNGIELRITDEDRRFFSDFEMFADALNHRFEPNEPWRLQERPDAELTGREEPEYGRRYEIFYNEYSVGNLQIFASQHYGPADPQVGTEIELQYARLLPFGEINRFISAIANFTASGNAEEAQRVKNTIHETMLNELWQHEFDPDLDSRNSGGSIELRFDGSAAAFLRTSTNRKARSISQDSQLRSKPASSLSALESKSSAIRNTSRNIRTWRERFRFDQMLHGCVSARAHRGNAKGILYRRRSDRIKLVFAAVHQSVCEHLGDIGASANVRSAPPTSDIRRGLGRSVSCPRRNSRY